MIGSSSSVRLGAPAVGAVFALIATVTFSGCFVSFEGYELSEGGGAAGLSASGGHATGGASGVGEPGGASEGGASGGGKAGGTSSAGASSAGMSNAGNGNVAGAPSGGSGAGGSGTGGSGAGGMSAGGTSGSGSSGGGSAGAPSGGTSGSGGTLKCPDLTIQIPKPAGGFYCIDRTEVKNVEYKAFVDDQSGTSGQATVCAWNTSYQPDTANGCTQYDPVNKANLPIACVDWCDAAAFCKWKGKHLCGKVTGGPSPTASFADANGAIRPTAVPNTNCEGGYSGLYDMSGNVGEWEDSCASENGANDQCLWRGGSYLDTNSTVGSAPSVLCNSNVHNTPKSASKARNTRDKEIGFRCCSEPMATP